MCIYYNKYANEIQINLFIIIYGILKIFIVKIIEKKNINILFLFLMNLFIHYILY